MQLSTLIEELQKHLKQYGDLPVFHLNENQLHEPLIGHSNQDYGPSFFSGTTWADLGLQPSLILDYDPLSKDPLQDNEL